MTQIITINAVDPAHLEEVKADMMRLGAPVIRCAESGHEGVLLALEGSHRLAAAKALGIAPILVTLSDDEMLTCDEIGYDDMGWFDGEPARVGDIRDRIGSPMGAYGGCEMLEIEA